MATGDRSNQTSGHSRVNILVVAIAAALLASACAATAPMHRSSPVATAAATPAPGTASTAGTLAASVMGTGSYPGYTVDALPRWSAQGARFVLKYPDPAGEPSPVLGISVWDVGQVYHDPCHWQGQAFDPGPSVENLVAALVAQKLRNATTPTDVTLAGYAGKYLEWSVPADLKSSSWTSFDACDSDGTYRDFLSWLGNGMGDRYEQVPGQVDQLWVLDVNGQRLVVDATYSPDTSQGDRAELEQVVNSLRFGVH